MVGREYHEGEGRELDLTKFDPGHISDEAYASARDTLVRACHDVFPFVKSSEGKEGILLIKRQNDPARGLVWPIGGGMRRGIPMEESLKKVVKKECGIDVRDIQALGLWGRFFWNTDPFESGKGVDDVGLAFYAVGEGQIQLDSLHSDPLIVDPEDYSGMRDSLHDYVRTNMDEAMAIAFG